MRLPMDLVCQILAGLGRRDIKAYIRAAATCKAWWEAAETVATLGPSVTQHTYSALKKWLSRPSVGARVTGIRFSRSLTPWTNVTWLERLVRLRSFTAICCRVPDAVFRHLHPAHLVHMNIHRLQMGARPDSTDIFSTAALVAFTNLRSISLTFAPGWAMAFVGPGLHHLRHLQTFECRRVPSVVVVGPLTTLSRHLSLYALDIISFQHGAEPLTPAASISLQSDGTALDTTTCLRSLEPTLQTLKLSSPGLMDAACTTHLTGLTFLEIDTGTLLVPDMTPLRALKKLSLNAAQCLVFHEHAAFPHTLQTRKLMTGNLPLSSMAYDQLVHAS